MAIQKTIFGAKVPFQKPKFDGDLRLQQMPDTSKQAAQPYFENVEALKQQYAIDSAAAEFEFEVRSNLEKNREIPDTFLSKLAPFSPTINTLFEKGKEAFEDFRSKQARDEAGRIARIAELDGGLEALQENYSAPIIKALGDNPESSAHLKSKLFSMDLGMQRRIASAQVKLGAKKYKPAFQDFLRSGNTIQVPDQSAPGGVRDLDVGQAKDLREVEAVMRAYDAQYERLFTSLGFPPEVVQEFRDNVYEDRIKMRQQLVEQVGGITGEQDRGLASLAWRGGETIQQTLERIAFSNKEGGKPGIFGFAPAVKRLSTEIKQSIRVGDTTLADIMRMEKEPSDIPGMTQGERRKPFFDDLKAELDKYNEKYAVTLPDQAKKQATAMVDSLFKEINSSGRRPSKEILQQIKQTLLDIPGLPADFVVNNKLLKALEESYTVEKEDIGKLRELYKTRIIDNEEYIDPGVLQARLFGHPGLYDEFREFNDRNGRVKADPKAKAGRERLDAFSFQARATEGGGLGLKYDINGKGVGVSSIIIPQLVKKQFDKFLAEALASGQEMSEDLVNTIVVKTQQWALDESKNVKSRMYFDTSKGQFTNVDKLSVVNPDGTTRLLSQEEQIKLTVAGSQKLKDFQAGAVAKYGRSANAYTKAFKDPELVDMLFSDDDINELVEAAANGEALPPRFRAITSITGGNPVLLARQVAKTKGKELIFNNRLDNPTLRATYTLDDFLRLRTQVMSNLPAGSRAQQRELQYVRNNTVLEPPQQQPEETTQQSEPAGTPEAAAQQGSPDDQSQGMGTGISPQAVQFLSNPAAQQTEQWLAALQNSIRQFKTKERAQAVWRKFGEQNGIEWLTQLVIE